MSKDLELGFFAKDLDSTEPTTYWRFMGFALKDGTPGVLLSSIALKRGHIGPDWDAARWFAFGPALREFQAINTRGDPLFDDELESTTLEGLIAENGAAIAKLELEEFGQKHVPISDASDAGSW